MPTTTPNFGWSVPVSTDLVKDGATAIELLGDSIDASLVDLKGGTTGQVLAKTSNTDMDFTWVAQDDSNAIQNAIVDAKGDLIAASAADTPARLAVGTNGQLLQADSTTATGLKWATVDTGALTLISSTTITAASSTSLNNVFSSTYDNYLVRLVITTTSTTTEVAMRMRASGTDATASNYYFTALSSNWDGSGGANWAGAAQNRARIGTQYSGEASGMEFTIMNPFAAQRTQYSGLYNAGAITVNESGTVMGMLANTTSYDGLTIYPGSGTMTGKLTVYGYSN